MLQTITDVGNSWYAAHGSVAPRMGVGDISRPGGGPFPPHDNHQNGLDVDVRYIRNDGIEAGLNLSGNTDAYSRELTLELIRYWVATGEVDQVYVDPAAGISSTDISGATLIIDNSGGHVDHFHIRLRDPDGPDSNNC